MAINFQKIGINKYQLKKQAGMKAEVIFYADDHLLPRLTQDLSLQQLAEAAMLPKVVSPVIGMPDIHEGFGLPIGGVMATEGLISVGAVGMDINCGVRLLTSKVIYDAKIFNPHFLHTLINQIERNIPIGLGGRRKERVNLDLNKITEEGVDYLVKQGYTRKEDLEVIEEKGRLAEANFEALTEKAKNRALKQLGTLGSGNHFIEIQRVAEIYEEDLATHFNLFNNQICLMIHSGSRALGQQTCVDYTNLFWKLEEKYGLSIPRKGLAALPVDSQEGQAYFGAMAASVNFAFCNRALMTYYIRQVFKNHFSGDLNLLYDVAHNIAKWEIHQGKKLLIHRKGATRALPADHPQNPRKYLHTGHPAIVPGSMGTPSFVMVGLGANKETFYSINHGAGRAMSRTEAKRKINPEDFEKQMQNIVYNKPFQVIADEAPQAYKNIEDVVETLVEAGLTKKVAKLVPLAVIKGD